MARDVSRRGSELLQAILPLMPSVAGKGKAQGQDPADGRGGDRETQGEAKVNATVGSDD
jgi:hypothetical protein